MKFFLRLIPLLINVASLHARYYLVMVFIGKKPPNKADDFRNEFEYAKADKSKEPYVAARLEELPADGLFTIGDGRRTEMKSRRKRRSVSEYVNEPLKPSQDYSWFQRSCVTKVSCPTNNSVEYTCKNKMP